MMTTRTWAIQEEGFSASPNNHGEEHQLSPKARIIISMDFTTEQSFSFTAFSIKLFAVLNISPSADL